VGAFVFVRGERREFFWSRGGAEFAEGFAGRRQSFETWGRCVVRIFIGYGEPRPRSLRLCAI
jgi:hypothetical protein